MQIRSKSGIFKPKIYIYVTDGVESVSVKEAFSNSHWFAAMKEEFDALQRTQTWTLVPSDTATKIIGTKWVF